MFSLPQQQLCEFSTCSKEHLFTHRNVKTRFLPKATWETKEIQRKLLKTNTLNTFAKTKNSQSGGNSTPNHYIQRNAHNSTCLTIISNSKQTIHSAAEAQRREEKKPYWPKLTAIALELNSIYSRNISKNVSDLWN